MKRRFYIFPGWGQRITDKNYQNLISLASKKYQVIPLKLFTRNRKYSLGSAESFLEIIHKIENQIIKPSSRDTIFGFSIGALEAYFLASRIPFRHIILCSLSPVFGKDLLRYTKRELSDFSPRQIHEMMQIKYAPLKARRVSVFYGEKEHHTVRARATAFGRRKKYTVVKIPHTGHDLNEIYLEEIKRAL